MTVINCKKLRFYNRFKVDFTIVGGQIGCPYFTVLFFFTVYSSLQQLASLCHASTASINQNVFYRIS